MQFVFCIFKRELGSWTPDGVLMAFELSVLSY
jgi:hypothetical protein